MKAIAIWKTASGKERLMLLCAALLAAMMATIGARFFTSKVLVRKLEENSQKNIKSMINAQLHSLYPFKESDIEPDVKPTIIQRLQQKNTAQKARIIEAPTRWINESLTGYYQIIHGARYMESAMGWKYIKRTGEPGQPTMMKDGYWTWFEGKTDTTEHIASVARLFKFCKAHNTNLLFVQAPGKISPDEPGISGVLDFSNQNADALFDGLRQNDVPSLDFRNIIKEEKLNHHALFFKTDHHWKPETGLWAAKHIAERLNRDFNFNIDVKLFDTEKFQVDIYPQWMLGSQGKRATLARADPEDFPLIYPKYPTDIEFTVPPLALHKRGDFLITCDISRLKQRDYYLTGLYEMYNYSNQSLKTIRNYANVPDKKLLFLTNSFGLVTAPILALGVQKTDILDLRSYTASVEAYIEKTQPDMVLILYDTESYKPIDWSSHTSFFDFR